MRKISQGTRKRLSPASLYPSDIQSIVAVLNELGEGQVTLYCPGYELDSVEELEQLVQQKETQFIRELRIARNSPRVDVRFYKSSASFSADEDTAALKGAAAKIYEIVSKRRRLFGSIAPLAALIAMIAGSFPIFQNAFLLGFSIQGIGWLFLGLNWVWGRNFYSKIWLSPRHIGPNFFRRNKDISRSCLSVPC